MGLNIWAAALDAVARWRFVQQRALETLEIFDGSNAERDAAERELKAALAALGAAVVRHADDPTRRATIEALLTDPAPPPPEPLQAEAPSTEPQREPTPPPEPDVTPAAAVTPPPAVVVAPPPAVVVAPPPAVLVAPPPARVAPSGPPIELDEALARRLAAGLGGLSATPSRGTGPGSDPSPVLRDALNTLNDPPGADSSVADVRDEVERIAAVLDRTLSRWAELAQDVDHALTAWFTARLRGAQVQAERVGDATSESRIAAEIRRLSKHSQTSRPGFVHGLALNHTPRTGSWESDAAQWEARAADLLRQIEQENAPPNPDDAIRQLAARAKDGLDPEVMVSELRALFKLGASPNDKRILNLARPYADALDGKVFAGLRKAIRDTVEAESTEDMVASSPIPADWPLFSRTRGRRALVVGGDPRPERAAKLAETFGFHSVEWLEGSTTRKVDGLAERMRSGSLDLVIVLRAFNSHKLSTAIFAVKSELCPVVLADGYGVNQVRLGIERFLGGSHP